MIGLWAEHDPHGPEAFVRRRVRDADLPAILHVVSVERQQIALAQRAAVQSAEAAAHESRGAPEAGLNREPALDRQVATGGLAESHDAEGFAAPKQNAAPAANLVLVFSRQFE